MSKPAIAYIVSDSGYLSHVKPIIDTIRHEYDHLIVTNMIRTADYAKKILKMKSFYTTHDHLIWQEIASRGIKTVVLVHQKIKDPPKGLIFKTIQIFHGVSFKSHVLHNWSPKRYTAVLVQGNHYFQPYVERYIEYRDRIHKSSFARSIYYENIPSNNTDKYVLYMPTHADAKSDNGLLFGIRTMCRSFDRLVIKLHPINLRKSPFMSKVRQIQAKYPNVEFIEENDWRYCNYHNLFYDSSCLVSDFSSVVCEYTMMDRPIVIMRGNEQGLHVKKGFDHLTQALFIHDRISPISLLVQKALAEFIPGSYPPIYISGAKKITDWIMEIDRDGKI